MRENTENPRVFFPIDLKPRDFAFREFDAAGEPRGTRAKFSICCAMFLTCNRSFWPANVCPYRNMGSSFGKPNSLTSVIFVLFGPSRQDVQLFFLFLMLHAERHTGIGGVITYHMYAVVIEFIWSYNCLISRRFIVYLLSHFPKRCDLNA